MDIQKKYARQLIKSAKKRAKKNGREISISKEWVKERLEKGVCEVTGVKFLYNKKEKYKSAPYVPSLDRIDSTKGYTPDNTQVVCNFFNICKWQWDHEDFTKILKYLEKVKI